MDTLKRRTADKSSLRQFFHILEHGEIDLVLILGGFGLVLWTFIGMYIFPVDFTDFSNMFPIGTTSFWTTNYIFTGVAMWYLAINKMPSTAALIVGSWCTIVWTWSSVARAMAQSNQQTITAIAVVYICIGLLIIHRSAKK